MDAFVESGRNSVSNYEIQPECREWAGSRRTGRPNPSGETKFAGANGDRENIVFPCFPTMSRNGNHTWSIHTLLGVLIIHTYSHLGMAPPPFSATKVKKIERRLHFPGGGDDVVYSPRVLRVRYGQELSPLIWLSLGTRICFDTNLCSQQQTDAVSRK